MYYLRIILFLKNLILWNLLRFEFFSKIRIKTFFWGGTEIINVSIFFIKGKIPSDLSFFKQLKNLRYQFFQFQTNLLMKF